MLDMLSRNVEDTDTLNPRFTTAQKTAELYTGYKSLVNLLHKSYLTELETYKEGVLITSGVSAALTSTLLGKEIIQGKNGILQVKNTSTVDGKWCRVMDFEDVIREENNLLGGTVNTPTAWVFGNKLWIKPLTISRVTVYFLGMPTDFTGLPLTTVPDINSSFHEMIVALAEAELWKSDRKLDRQAAALKTVYEQVVLLNQKYERPEGVGEKHLQRGK